MISNISSIYANEDEQMMYEYTAKGILNQYGIKNGICLEIGTGPGYLGVQLVRQSDMSIYTIDLSADALEKAKKNAELLGIKDKIHFIHADVAKLPFDDHFADLIISRGSMWFWKDQINGIREIYRVLKTNGVAFIGGGFGKEFLPNEVWERVVAYKKEQWKKVKKERGIDIPALIPTEEQLKEILTKADIPTYRIISDYPGVWIEIRK